LFSQAFCAAEAMIRATQSHWFCIVFLIPAALMIAVHELFGLSDSMLGIMAGEPPPTTFETFYNLMMCLMFYAGVIGYVAHTFLLAKLGILWLVAKLLILAAGWYALLAGLG
jgi:hypothetical protein